MKDHRCEIDASVFLLGQDGLVPGDDWFVFYSQPDSPDGSVSFRQDGHQDREIIGIDLDRLDRRIRKLVFVLTINEAHENGLNFGMITEGWLRLMDARNGEEIVSFRLEELNDGVTSMTMGELYLHNGEWKFNPVGRGVNRDLAGQCAMYGVQVC